MVQWDTRGRVETFVHEHIILNQWEPTLWKVNTPVCLPRWLTSNLTNTTDVESLPTTTFPLNTNSLQTAQILHLYPIYEQDFTLETNKSSPARGGSPLDSVTVLGHTGQTLVRHWYHQRTNE